MAQWRMDMCGSARRPTGAWGCMFDLGWHEAGAERRAVPGVRRGLSDLRHKTLSELRRKTLARAVCCAVQAAA
jgi:hypothetical protein